MKLGTCAVIILLLSLQVYARKVAVIWGGGGEHSSYKSTMFDQDIKALAPKLQNARYEIWMAFGTGHPESERLAEDIVGPGKNEKFNPETVQRHINQLIQMIQDGELTEKDQILLVINTHGEDPLKTPLGKTHLVMTGFSDDTNKSKDLLLDVIFPLRETAEKKGIKLAILDFSCFSGSSLSLASAKTCVVAASAAEEPSYQQFALKMTSSMRPQRNLESAFLEARKYVDSFGLTRDGSAATYMASPEISTYANSIAKIYLMGSISQFAPQLKKKSSECVSCQRHEFYLKNTHSKSVQDIKIQLLSFQETYQSEELRNLHGKLSSKFQTDPSARDIGFESQLRRSLQPYYGLERQIYDKVYQEFSNGAHPNPCRDFDF